MQADESQEDRVRAFRARPRGDSCGAGCGEISLSARNILDEKYMTFTEPDPDGNSDQAAPLHEVFLEVHLNERR